MEVQSSPLLFDSARLWRAVVLGSDDPAGDEFAKKLALSSPLGHLNFPLKDLMLTPLIAACIADKPRLVKLLLGWGAGAEHPDDAGWTPLHWCAQSGHVECAKALLDFGADPNASHPGELASALHFCAQSSSSDCALLLIEHGADPRVSEPETGASAAHWGAHDLIFSRCAMIRDGFMLGADRFGRGPLHWATRQSACDEQALAACEHWLALGADPSSLDCWGNKASDLARAHGYRTCALLLDSWSEREQLSELISTPPADTGTETSRL